MLTMSGELSSLALLSAPYALLLIQLLVWLMNLGTAGYAHGETEFPDSSLSLQRQNPKAPVSITQSMINITLTIICEAGFGILPSERARKEDGLTLYECMNVSSSLFDAYTSIM